MIIGLEGVSCTGKTTLAGRLAQTLHDPLVVPCYYHTAADPTRLPPPVAANAREQMEGLAILLDLEATRRRWACQAVAAGRDVVLDRTVDTLLAHSYAIARLNGFDSDTAARALVTRRAVVVPDLTLLLRAGHDVLARRAAGRPGMPTIFYDRWFTEHFNGWFRRCPLTPMWVELDAEADPGTLAHCAAQQIHRWATDTGAGAAGRGLVRGST